MIKENISGWEAMQLIRGDHSLEARMVGNSVWFDYESRLTLNNALIFRCYDENCWFVRAKQTNLEKVMEEIQSTPIRSIKSRFPEIYVNLNDLKPILAKYIKE